MKINIRLSLRKKFFIALLSILAINVIIISLFSGLFFKNIMFNSAKDKLNDIRIKVENSYLKDDQELLSEAVKECATNNIVMLIYNSKSNQTLYSTIRGENGVNYSAIDPILWLKTVNQEQIFKLLDRKNPIITNQNNGSGNFVNSYSKLPDFSYLLMATPSEYIENSANISIKFFVTVSFITLVIGSIILYFVVKKLISPIKEIEQTANSITNLDFDKKCEIHTKDELEDLANNINIMSQKLKENIDILKEDLKREEMTNKLRREFIANITHDLKTPLSLILAYIENLEDDNIKKEESIKIVNEQVNNMNKLINETLTLSRLESKMTKYEFTPFQISEIIYDTLNNFKMIVIKNNINIIKEIDQELIVNGDYNYLKQAFSNYFENAIKYVNDKKIIKVIAKREDDNIIVEVKNSTDNINKEDINNLFAMYYKSDKSRNKFSNSYGIGLAIVKNIIKDHGGEVGVYTKDDEITFYFKLKIYSEDFDN